MSKKTEALKAIEAAVKELQAQPEPGPVDFDLVLSTVEKGVMVLGIGALVVIAGTLIKLTWMLSHPDAPEWHDVWEGSGRDTRSHTPPAA